MLKYLLQFEDVKQCLNSKDFCTFIKICYKEKKLTSFVIMEMFNQVLCNEFIELCTGECGPSYKGSMFETGDNNRNSSYTELPYVLTVHEVTDIENETMRLMDYINCYEKNNSDSFDENEMLLYLHFHHGGFSIVRHASTKVKNPNFLFGCSITPFSITPDITSRPPIGRIEVLSEIWKNDIRITSTNTSKAIIIFCDLTSKDIGIRRNY
ncbi:hypothetical protein Avbf_13147 [Armadillidium vulgare]|nr:hypothetical protein Avbf_13147 [Armadillidium vulgare]